MTRFETTGRAADAFDRRMQALHARATDAVSARTRAQLDARRVQARRPASAPRRRAWSFATAAAVAVLALGIGWRVALVPPGATGAPSTSTPVVATPVAVEDDAYGAFAEDPDLFLWLASADAQPLAME